MPLAIVTGATGGLGLKIAEKLAEKKYDLLLVARSEATLNEVAARLASHGVSVSTVAVDLATPDGLAKLEAEIRSRSEVEVLVNNAGMGTYGRFWECPPEDEEHSVQLNINALVRLTHVVLPGMVAWKRGTVINVSSMAGFQPVPYFATYAATKSFVLHFSEAIDAELRGNGYENVRVIALAPGPMETGFQGRAGVTKEEYGTVPWENIDAVAQKAVDAIGGRGPAALITGWGTKILVFLNRFTPRRIVAAVGQRLTRPRQERPRLKV